MKKFIKKYLLLVLVLIAVVGFFTPTKKSLATDALGDCTVGKSVTHDSTLKDCRASDTNATWSGYYNLLAPVPCDKTDTSLCDSNGLLTKFDPNDANGKNPALGKYLNLMILAIIGISAVLSVVMIVIGGVEYMTSELVSSKEAGKEKIRDALLGLLIALGAYVLLNTINPDLLKTDINIASVQISGSIQNSIYDKPITAANIARCTPVASGPCAVSNLSAFGAKADGMSKICNIESGGNPSAASGTDKGTDGTVFSFGLFQINLLSNGSVIKDASGNSCANLFVLSDGSPISGSNYIKKDASGKVYYDAKLKAGAQSQYDSCKATLVDPTKNTQVATTLFQQGSSAFNNSMFAWKGDMGVCSSAFN